MNILEYSDHVTIIQNDKNSIDSYQSEVAQKQMEMFDPILKHMKEKYRIELTPTKDITHPGQNVDIFNHYLKELDPIALTALYKIANATASVCIGMALIDEIIDIETALDLSYIEQDIQI